MSPTFSAPTSSVSPVRIPSLDGLRAASIILVLFSHLLGTQGFLGRDWQRYTGDLGNLGVRIFFIISGFLITSLLRSEFALTGRISLARFYLRRSFRIFPAFYLCLAVVGILHQTGVIRLHAHDLLMAGTYTINYRTAVERSWNVGHMWSLAVEEQFYLLWPALLVLFGARRAILWASGVVILVVPLIRMSTWHWWPDSLPGIKWQFQTVCDSLAAGCFLAGVREWLGRQRRIDKWLRSNMMIILPVLAALMNVWISGRPRLNYLIGQTFMNICIVIFLYHCIREPTGFVGRILNWRPAVALGALSYSLYLWQQLFLNRHSDAWFCAFPQNLLLALLAAVISYRLIERPFLTLRPVVESRVFGPLSPVEASPTTPVTTR